MQPHLSEYQRKQKERPALPSTTKKDDTEPFNKALKRKSSVEPLDDRGSPLPDLPRELREKQELIDSAAGKKKRLSPTPPSQKPPDSSLGQRSGSRFVSGAAREKKESIQEIIAKGLKDPLEFIKLIRERKDAGYLYMAAAVPRSSIEYNPYNLKYV